MPWNDPISIKSNPLSHHTEWSTVKSTVNFAASAETNMYAFIQNNCIIPSPLILTPTPNNKHLRQLLLWMYFWETLNNFFLKHAFLKPIKMTFYTALKIFPEIEFRSGP